MEPFLARGGLFKVRRQRVQIFTRWTRPLISRVCLWTLALKRVLVWRLEWLTLLPLIPAFKQISQRIVDKSLSGESGLKPLGDQFNTRANPLTTTTTARVFPLFPVRPERVEGSP